MIDKASAAPTNGNIAAENNQSSTSFRCGAGIVLCSMTFERLGTCSNAMHKVSDAPSALRSSADIDRCDQGSGLRDPEVSPKFVVVVFILAVAAVAD